MDDVAAVQNICSLSEHDFQRNLVNQLVHDITKDVGLLGKARLPEDQKVRIRKCTVHRARTLLNSTSLDEAYHGPI